MGQSLRKALKSTGIRSTLKDTWDPGMPWLGEVAFAEIHQHKAWEPWNIGCFLQPRENTNISHNQEKYNLKFSKG